MPTSNFTQILEEKQYFAACFYHIICPSKIKVLSLQSQDQRAAPAIFMNFVGKLKIKNKRNAH